MTNGLHSRIAVAAMLWSLALTGHAQVAGTTQGSITVIQAPQVALGWSAKRNILGKTVFNEKDQKVGTISDLIIAPDTSISYVIIGAGGFVGIGKHDIAIQASDLQTNGEKFVLAGATREKLKAMPQFEYAKKR